jgi:hypothetical protein
MTRTQAYLVIGLLCVPISGALLLRTLFHDEPRGLGLVVAVVAFTGTGFLLAYQRRVHRVRMYGPFYCAWNEHCQQCPTCRGARAGKGVPLCVQGQVLYDEFCREKLV